MIQRLDSSFQFGLEGRNRSPDLLIQLRVDRQAAAGPQAIAANHDVDADLAIDADESAVVGHGYMPTEGQFHLRHADAEHDRPTDREALPANAE